MEKKKTNVKNIIIATSIIVLIILIAITVMLFLENKRENEAIPTISLLGESSIQLQLNDEYLENGATAMLQEENITKRIQMSGNVDTTKTGRYEIRYSVANNKNKNMVEIIRTIDVIDSIKPELKLNGKEKISLYIGEKYTEEGATATDNYDGDISSKITTSGEVDTKKAGEYTIKYYVQDTSANTAEISRIITVKKKPQAASISGKGIPVLMYHFFYDGKVSQGKDSNWMEISKFEEQIKYLAENNYYFPSWQEVENYIEGKINLPSKSVVITADDGDPSFFNLAVPIIKKYNAKATSFVVSSWYAWNAVQYKSENIQLESHTNNMHRNGTNGKGIFLSNSYEEAINDIKTSQKELGGSTVLAYPFGQYNDHAKKVLTDAGIKLAFTTRNGRVYKGSDKLELSRVRVNAGISLNGFKELVK